MIRAIKAHINIFIHSAVTMTIIITVVIACKNNQLVINLLNLINNHDQHYDQD